MSTMETFYCNCLQCFANSRVNMYHLLLEKLLVSWGYINRKDDILIAESHGAYLVPSEHDNALLYEVDARSGVCSCPYGMSGRCCKHQIAVFKWYHEALPNVPPVTAQARYMAARLALADDAPAPQFYASITSPEAVPLCVRHVPKQPTTAVYSWTTLMTSVLQQQMTMLRRWYIMYRRRLQTITNTVEFDFWSDVLVMAYLDNVAEFTNACGNGTDTTATDLAGRRTYGSLRLLWQMVPHHLPVKWRLAISAYCGGCVPTACST